MSVQRPQVSSADGTRLLAVNTANDALEIFDVSDTGALPVLL